MPDVPLVSIVICTRDRPELLRRCLATLRGVRDPNYEILVVDNTRPRVLDPGEIAAYGARVVHEPKLGLSFARNRGVAEARGELIAFIDDDCEADPGWLDGLREGFREPDVMCVTGRVQPSSVDRRSHYWFEHFSSFDRGSHSRRFEYAPGSFAFPHVAGMLGSGCNMAFRREVFDRLGTFDTALDVGVVRGGGDLDFVARLLDAGEPAAYVPNATVRHHHRDTMPSLVWQLFGYGVGVGSLSMKQIFDRSSGVREVCDYHVRWIRHLIQSLSPLGRRSRLAGYVLLATLLAGDLCAPLPYLWYRFVSPKARRSRVAASSGR